MLEKVNMTFMPIIFKEVILYLVMVENIKQAQQRSQKLNPIEMAI